MRTIICFLILLVAEARAQEPSWLQSWNLKFYNIVTDSVVWRCERVENIGDTSCAHEWIIDDRTTRRPGVSCLVDHNGGHCSWDDAIEHRICRKCLRKEVWGESWYQHWVTPPKSEYEKLDSVLLEKRKREMP